MFLREVHARAIKDSRGEDTIEVSVNGQRSSSPSGKSTGKYETPTYHRSINWNIDFLNSFSSNLKINKFDDLKKVEDHIKRKLKLKDAKKFGANALFAFESAVLKALAQEKKKQLWQVVNPRAKNVPRIVGNIVGGGLHSHNPDHPEFQEFHVIPKTNKVHHAVSVMKRLHQDIVPFMNASRINDEGAWQTSHSNEEILATLASMTKEVFLGVDVAASSFYRNDHYNYRSKDLSKERQVEFINNLIDVFNIFYCEDPLEENDFSGFSKISKKHLVVGDDLTATQLERVKRAVKIRSINAMIVKPNQNGSLLEVKKIVSFCKKNRIQTVMSHRSGETLDDSLADLAFGFQTDFIKCGIVTPWRDAKLQRLMEIENSIG